MGNQASSSSTYQAYVEALERGRQGQQANVPPDLDPQEVLGVPKGYTWDQLKAAYRRMAAIVHPDKGGTDQLFQYVTDCFKKLAYDLQARDTDKPHYELKKQSQAFYEENRGGGRGDMPKMQSAEMMRRFHQAFEENHLEDEEYDFGYGDIMEKSSAVREDIKIKKAIRGKFTADKLNRAFEENVPLTQDVVVYKEPEPMVLSNRLACTEIGSGRPEDFSSSIESGGLAYTDYRKAHTTTRLVDPRAVQPRAEYKSIKAYEAARAQAISRPKTDEELAWEEEKRRKEEAAEAARLERLRQRDRAIGIHYDKVNQLLLGGPGPGPAPR